MNRRLILGVLILATILAAFAAEAVLINEVCVSAMMTDTSTTVDYGEICR